MLSRLLLPFTFQSADMKNAYLLFNKEAEEKLLMLIQAIVTMTFVVLTLVGIFLNVGLGEIMIRVGFIFVSLIFFVIRKRWPNIYKKLMILLGAGFMFYIIVYILELYKQPNDKNAFLSGNAMGMLEIIFVLSFKTLWLRIFSFAMLFTVKVGCLSENFQIQTRIFIQFLVTVAQIFFFCLYHDILDRKTFSIIYKSSEKIKKFQDLLSNDLPSSVMIMSSNFSNILYSNKFFQQKFSKDGNIGNTEKIIKDLFTKLILQEEQQKTLIEYQQKTSLLDYLVRLPQDNFQITGQEKPQELYASHKDEQGSELYYEIRLRRIMWDNKFSYAIVMNDITDKQLVAALKIADTQKDRVIATVSHELRTPINGIVGLLEMALELAADKIQENYLKYCKSCSKLLLYLVNAILDLSQLRNNSLKIVKDHFSMTDMLEEIRSLYIFQSHQKGIDFIIEKDPSICDEIYTDKYRLIEILINLLGNAMKFTFKGAIKLKVSKNNERKDSLIFHIEDTGLGIMEKDKCKLFKMFGKIEQTDKSINTHGAGLGLTIANELVKSLNIDYKDTNIMFESEYNKGSHFWFELDVSKPCEDIYLIDHENIDLRSNDENTKDFEELIDTNLSPMMKFQKFGCQDHSHNETNPFLHISQKTDQSHFFPKSEEKTLKEVLLIDDNPLNLMAAGFILEKFNLKVTKALNGQEGLKILEESLITNKKYFLILTDIQMPIMDGLEMSKKIKEKIKQKEMYWVPIVALTARKLDQQEHQIYKDCGIAFSLEKPLISSEIEKVITKLSSKAEKIEELD